MADTTKKLGIVSIGTDEYLIPTKTSELINDSGFINDAPHPSTINPVMDGTADTGQSPDYARADHVHPHDTTKVDKVSGKGLSSNDFTSSEKSKLQTVGYNADANQNAFSTILIDGNTTGVRTFDAARVTDTLTLTGGYNVTLSVDAENRKVTIDEIPYPDATTAYSGLMSTSDKTKLNGIAAGAEVNVQSDWNATTGDAYIKNKPTLGTASVKDVAASGDASATQVVMGNDTRLTDSRPASDVSAWAKADTKPTYTASEVGAIPTSQKGANNGVAELDANGLVPTSQLPSFVDDVLEYSAKASFPTTGETGKIYVDTSTNLTYRWSGSAYVEISPSLALGTTSSTAFRGDYGNTAYNHATDSSKLTTATSSGLYKVASTAQGHIASLTAVQKSDITDLGIPAQDTTYVFDGTYDASTNKAATVSTVSNAISSAVPSAATATPLMDGTAAVGTSSKYAKEDHVHPSDSSKVDVSSSGSLASTINLVANISNENGVIDLYSEPQSGSTVSKTGMHIGYDDVHGYYGDDSYFSMTEAGFEASYVSSSGKRLRSYAGPNSSGMSIDGQELDSWGSIDLGFDHNTDDAIASLYVRGAVNSGEYPENEILVTPTTTTIKNVVTPVDNGDAVPKSYVDNAISSVPPSTWYGTSITGASTAVKVVDCEGFELTTGAMISILFAQANTSTLLYLDVNSTGSKTVCIGNRPVGSSSSDLLRWSDYTMLTLLYDGSFFRYISAVSPGGNTHPDGAGSWYGTSSTAATTAAKVCTVTNYRLTPGAIVSITFSNANTYVADVLTMNVESTGAKSIFVNNGPTSSTNTLTWDAGETLTFVYSGTVGGGYYFVGRSKQTDEKLSTAVTSSGTAYYPVLGNATTSAETKYYDPKFGYYRDSSIAQLYVGSITNYSDNPDQINLEFLTKTGGAAIEAKNLTSINEYILPNKGGTFALTSDIIDNKVAQNNSTAANDYRVLLSSSTSDSNQTAEANKSAGLRFMPSTNHLYVGSSGQDALITVSPRMHLGVYTRYTQTGEAESSTSYGVGIGIDNALAYNSYLTTSALLFQHWNASRPSGGVPSSTNYVDSMCSTSNAHVLLRDYSGKNSLTTESELTSALLKFTNSAGTEFTVGPTKIDKWDAHVSNGNYSLTAATTQAVYPIKIDSRGHISAHGSAVTIPTASTATPAMDGTASYGSGTVYARSNHVHPTDTSRAAKANFISFTVSSTTTTKSLTSGHVYLLVTKRMNNSAAGGLYIVAPHTTTGSVTEIKAGTGTTVSIDTTTLTVTTTANNVYCRLVDLNMPD